MFELFEEIFWEVAEENGITEWWVLFDSELMDEATDRIEARYGLSTEYIEWYNQMAEDLWEEVLFLFTFIGYYAAGRAWLGAAVFA